MKVLLLPISIVGSGKTSLAKMLKDSLEGKLAHIQSDDIRVKRPAPVFLSTVIAQFSLFDIVFADKNNHLPQHRAQLCKLFKEAYPYGKIICLAWDLDSFNPEELKTIIHDRIIGRGDQHQTLTARTKDLPRIINMFIKDRVSYAPDRPEDALIDEVVRIPLLNTPEENLFLVSSVLIDSL